MFAIRFAVLLTFVLVVPSDAQEVVLSLTLTDLSEQKPVELRARKIPYRDGLFVEASKMAGILKGDIIIKMGEARVRNMAAYREWLSTAKGGESQEFMVYRRDRFGRYDTAKVAVTLPSSKKIASGGKTKGDESPLNVADPFGSPSNTIGPRILDQKSASLAAYLGELDRRRSATGEAKVYFDKKLSYEPKAGLIGYASDARLVQRLDGGKVLVEIAETTLVVEGWDANALKKAEDKTKLLNKPLLIGPTATYITAEGTKGSALTAEVFDLDAALGK